MNPTTSPTTIGDPPRTRHHPPGDRTPVRHAGRSDPYALAARGWPVFPVRLTPGPDGRVWQQYPSAGAAR